MQNQTFINERENICEIARLLWERKLTNALGGNISARASESTLLITPTKMSEEKHCNLTADDILQIDFKGQIIDGIGGLSRETDMHIALLKNFPKIGAVIHAHPQNAMVFAAAEKPIPSLTEATEDFGEVGLCKFAPTCTPELALSVFAYFAEKANDKNSAFAKMGTLAAIMPKHGVVVAAPTLNAAFAYLEMLETDAYCALHIDKINS